MACVARDVLDLVLLECSRTVYETAPERLREVAGHLIGDVKRCDEKIDPNDDMCSCCRSMLHELSLQLLAGARHGAHGSEALKTALEALVHGWRGIAESDKTSVFAARAFAQCADELEMAMSRNAPTDPAPPPSTRETQPTIPDGRTV